MLATLYEIDSAVLREIREDPEDDEVRAQFAQLLLEEHSATYADICARKIHPKACEQVTLDDNQRFQTTGEDNALQHAIDGKPIAVTVNEDRTGGSNYCFMAEDGGAYRVLDAEPESAVWVYYKYIPDAFTKNLKAESDTGDETNVPMLVPEIYRKAFVYNGAAAILRSKGMFQSMATYQNLAENEISKIRDIGKQETVRNSFLRTSRRTARLR